MVTEKHFKPKELAELWGFSTDTIRAWFDLEPGILIEHRPETMHKRGYKSMRIPESIARRVYESRLQKS